MAPKVKADAVEQAFLDAPIDEHTESAEERLKVDAARAEYERTGVTLDAAQVTALLQARQK